MPSPFPGMDPYLESPAHWSDFHARFINSLADAINDRLPENDVARISEHVMMIAPTLRDEGDEGVAYVPDVNWSVRDRFPLIAIPLSPLDQDVLLDLATPFNVAYDAGRYSKLVRYDSPPAAPLFSADDVTWIKATLATAASSRIGK